MYSKKNYNVYQTFCSKLPKGKPSDDQIRELIQNIESADSSQRDAIAMLILEHAKIHEDLLDKKNVPYGIVQEGEDCVIEIKNLPDELIWILVRFSEVMTKKED